MFGERAFGWNGGAKTPRQDSAYFNGAAHEGRLVYGFLEHPQHVVRGLLEANALCYAPCEILEPLHSAAS